MAEACAKSASGDDAAEAELKLLRASGDASAFAKELRLLRGGFGDGPTDADTLVDLALEAEASGLPVLACACWQQASSADPTRTDPVTNLGVLLKSLGRIPEACAEHLRAQRINPSLRSTEAQRLLAGGTLFGSTECSQATLHEAARVLRDVLVNGGFSAGAVQNKVLAIGSEGGPATGIELFLRREALLDTLTVGWERTNILLLLYACGAALPVNVIEGALGETDLARLLEQGLLVQPPPVDADIALLVSPVQIYPLSVHGGVGHSVDAHNDGGRDDLFVATDWDLESLLSSKNSVMSVGVDSLNLVHLAPRVNGCSRILDLCCGSGVQSLVAARLSPVAEVIAADINPRAIRFCEFNTALNCFVDRLKPTVSNCYSSVEASILFDVILANPPFVAMPRPPEGATEYMEWALYADGGPDGADVINAIVEGAEGRLQPGGHLALVSEFPNILTAHEWLPGGGMDLALCYNPLHVQDCDEYSNNRSEERGWPWASQQEWKSNLAAHGVANMASSGLLLAVRPPSAAANVRRRLIRMEEGGPESENLSLLGSARDAVLAVWAEMLPSRD